MAQRWVKKASGEVVEFREEKLRQSLFNSGASEELIARIQQKIDQELTETTTTREIYKRAYQLLRASSSKLAGKYKLKTAILELGPSGYPFERFMGKLFEYQGFDVAVGIEMNGRCLSHEVDISAKKDGLWIIGECKHHSNPGYKSDVKTPLYVHSRFNDIVNGLKPDNQRQKFECWIMTNTRFTSDAEQYAGCYGLRLLAWDYPGKGNLRERIELSGLYPITCLYSLTRKEKETLLADNIVLCRELIENPELLAPIDKRKHAKILNESGNLCSY
jgi:hypothetical protein